jgi:hypothetical protein
MNIEEIKSTLNYLLDNNLELTEQGLDKIAINLVGEAGIGKTSVIKQLAEERGAGYKRLNLSELEEIGDLVGVPQKEFMMVKNGEEKRVAEKLINQFINLGYDLCPDCDPVMSYAVPEWVPQDPEQEFILFLDDFSRANTMFMQAIMSLMQFGEYISWKLPKKCHLILSSNPDDGSYSVTDLDPAQKSRMINFTMDFDVQCWAKWADKVGLRSEWINFGLLCPEIFDRGKHINARSFTLFANACKGIKQPDSEQGLEKICTISKGCFGDDYVSGLFVQFVHNHLDKLINAEEVVNGEWKVVKAKLIDNIYRKGNYDASVASTLTLRLSNYIEQYFAMGSEKGKSDKVIDRLVDICTDDKEKTLFSEDLLFRLIKHLHAEYPQRCQKLLKYPQIRQKLIG